MDLFLSYAALPLQVRWLICALALPLLMLAGHQAAHAAGGDLVVDVVQTGRADARTEVREALVFRIRANDPGVGDRDGDGIRNVDLIILDEDGREVYRRRENNAGYCAFGGGEPECTVYVFADNDNNWPNGEPIRDGGEYTLRAIVNANDGRQAVLDAVIGITLAQDDEPRDLEAAVIETGAGDSDSTARGALVFRVRANDPTVGDRDGSGIRNVDLIILDEDGREVYRKRENSAGYCAFGGGEPNCTIYVFDENDNVWPSGEPIRDRGEYTLRAVVNANDGRRTVVERTVTLELENNDDDLIAEMVEIGTDDGSSFSESDGAAVAEGALVFRVRANDPRRGNRDGDGVRNVDLIILDDDGREVYRRRESTAGYCAFGGGEPECNVWVFDDHNNRWPNGRAIRRGERHTLRAVVNANDGRRTVIDTEVEIR